MRHRHRGVFAVFSLLALAAVSGVLAWRFWAYHLPDPQRADREGLLRWLVFRDLADEPWGRQLVMVDRLTDEMRAGVDFGGEARSLSESRQERLRRNIEQLKFVWFQSRIDGYAKCRAEQRFPYLQEQLAVVLAWSDVDLQFPDAAITTDSDSQRYAFTMQFFADIERWTAAAAAERAARMRSAVQDGLLCWLATRSLADEPRGTRRELARRIVEELNAGLTLSRLDDGLSVEQRATLKSNGLLLLEAWLHVEAERFADLPAAHRTAYLDARLDDVADWELVDWFADGSGGVPAVNSTAGLVGLMTQVDQWIERAEPEHRPRLRTLVQQLQQRMVWRGLQDWLPESAE
jgi:hypothetical protein